MRPDAQQYDYVNDHHAFLAGKGNLFLVLPESLLVPSETTGELPGKINAYILVRVIHSAFGKDCNVRCACNQAV